MNLNHRVDLDFDLTFHEDINIITGKNGSGKTTLLKLLWYAISGNLERIIPEISFDSFQIVTDSMTLSMTVERKHKQKTIKLKFQIGDGEPKASERSLNKSGDWHELDEANRAIIRLSDSSVFFPTFRRIEGGFSIATRPNDEDVVRYMGTRVVYQHKLVSGFSDTSGLQQSINMLSERLSVGQHRFVASISTDDIVRLLTSKYAEISERTNRLHMDLSRFILTSVHEDPVPLIAEESTEQAESRESLNSIRQRARQVTEQSEALLRPFSVLSELIKRIFQYKGIKLSDPVTLGETRDAIASEVLSAGEKQMLSFLCYNAFSDKACIFIDEPEISLHVDWQRILFPILLEQATGNQFIVATHSPFIYTKYSDKELILSSDRGADDANAQNDRSRDNQLPSQDEPAYPVS